MGLLTYNWHLKALALVCAAMFWSLVALSENPTQDQDFQNVAVTPVGLGSGLAIVNPLPAVTLHVKGPAAVLRTLRPSSFQATLDLRGLHDGLHRVLITVHSSVGTQVTVDSVTPSSVDLLLDHVGTRSVPVRVTYSGLGALPDGYQLGTPQVQPESVLLQGPTGAIQAFNSAEVDIDLTGARSDIVRNAPVVLRDSHGAPVNNVAAFPPVISVNVPVHAVVISRQLPVLPSLNGTLPVGAYLTRLGLDPVTVTVTGPATEVDGLTGISLQPVDLATVPTGTNQYALATQSPAADVKVSPDRVLMTLVVAAPLAQRTFLFTDLPFTGLDPAYKATYTSFSGSVVLSGTADRLAQLAEADLSLRLDLTGLIPSGTPYPVRISFTLPSGTTLVSISPSSVPVTITAR